MKKNVSIKKLLTIIIILSFIAIIIVNNNESIHKKTTFEEDIIEIKKIADRTYDAEALLELGRLYVLNNQNDEAIKTYLSILEDDDENSMAWHRLGLVYVETGDFKKALDARAKVATIDVTEASSYYYYSLILFMFDPDEAIIIGNKFIKLANIEKTVSDESILEYQQMLGSFDENYNKGEIFLAYKSLLDSDMFYNETLKIEIINKLIKEKNINQIEINELKEIKTRIEKSLI